MVLNQTHENNPNIKKHKAIGRGVSGEGWRREGEGWKVGKNRKRREGFPYILPFPAANHCTYPAATPQL